ncbi:hypothetical protein CRI94_07255 [Longibacter salinarum]|uniref:Uncharacterized protein n=1 Tax=Longibacter salinarum TaxID=1850348 RepID=A0A2A8CYS0_9BACT|nr:hypothetical protein [Longibacter salinarum]PEN13852.1 hypothetical protein CRI94_07255 [Longibacter salinarum]
MSSSTSVTIQLSKDHHDWLQRVAERCNLSPSGVVELQVLAQAHLADLRESGTAALPALDSSAQQDDPSLPEEDASVMDMLNSARDRLDRWEKKRQQVDGQNSRLEALRRRLDAVRGSAEASDFGPKRTSKSSTTLIQQALARIQSIHSPSAKSNSVDTEGAPTSMFDIADEDDG